VSDVRRNSGWSWWSCSSWDEDYVMFFDYMWLCDYVSWNQLQPATNWLSKSAIRRPHLIRAFRHFSKALHPGTTVHGPFSTVIFSDFSDRSRVLKILKDQGSKTCVKFCFEFCISCSSRFFRRFSEVSPGRCQKWIPRRRHWRKAHRRRAWRDSPGRANSIQFVHAVHAVHAVHDLVWNTEFPSDWELLSFQM
jgi:hypothetical protein